MVNFVGIEIKNMIFVYLFGLCIIFVMDFCKVNGGSFQDNFVIEDGIFLFVVFLLFLVGVSFSVKIIGIDKYFVIDLFEKIFQVCMLISYMLFDFNIFFFFLFSIIIMLKF